MDDLTSLRDLGEALDQELRGPSPRLRHRVLTDIGRPPGRAGRWPARPGPLGWRLAVTAGLAVALAAALLTVSTLGLWGGSPAASARAAGILRKAAVAARNEPVLVATPAQFIYIRSVGSSAVFDGCCRLASVDTSLSEIWLSVNGTRPGLERAQPRSPANLNRATGPWQGIALPGCRDGRVVGGDPASAWVPPPAPGQPARQAVPRCVPQPAYPRVPSTARAMLAYLYRTSQGQNPPDVEAFIHAGDLIRQSYLRPAALAALFNAVTEIPGVSVADHAVNAAGQPGVAVQQAYNGISHQLIFNPRTYAFIGEREVVVNASSGLKVGIVMDSTAILGLAVVDQAGQLPPSPR